MCESGIDLGFDLLSQEDGLDFPEDDGFYKLKSRVLEPLAPR